MFIRNDSQEILNEILNNTMVTMSLGMASIPGSVSRTLLEAISYANSYTIDYVNSRIYRIFPDTATGADLDLIGSRFGITRYPNESDESYRSRLSYIPRVYATSNETAIKNMLLGVTGVREVYLKPNVFGIGSFGVYVEQIFPGEKGVIDDSIITECESRLQDFAAAGIKYLVLTPNYVTVDIDVSLKVIDDSAVSGLSSSVTSGISGYLNDLKMGDGVSYNKLLATISDAVGDNVVDFQITKILTNGVLHLNSNIIASFDDKFIPGTVRVSWSL